MTGARYSAPDADALSADNSLMKILITPSQLVYLIADNSSKTVVTLQPYQFSRITSTDDWLQSIDAIIEKDWLLKKEVAETRIGIFTPSFTLIPDKFDTGFTREEILKLNCRIADSSIIGSDSILNTNVHLVYALPGAIVEKLSWPDTVSIQHTTSALVGYLLSSKEASEKERLYIYVQSSSFQLIFIRDNSLRFCNSFNYKSPEDFMYHLLFCCKQLRLDHELVPLTLMGEVMRDSSLFQLLVKYIRQVEFSKPCTALNFHSDYPLPAHFFFNLFCI